MIKWLIILMLMLSFATAEAKYAFPFPQGMDISARFHGTVHRNDLIKTDDVYKLPATNVISFESGSYSDWHTHGSMTVVGIAGTGIYQEWGKVPILIRPGDVVNIPAGVSHFHGATKDSAFQQFVIYDSKWKVLDGFKAHTGKVSATEYEQSNLTVAAPKTTQKNDSDFLFGNGVKKFTSSNFNQPVLLGKVLTKPNAANSPEWIYVAFNAGTYNRWHSHKTGQVLIATEGIGYHQIKGEKPQVLRPGDVVFCPPGVIHWHGATPDSKFAHIAINPNDNHEVIWYEFPEYTYLQ